MSDEPVGNGATTLDWLVQAHPWLRECLRAEVAAEHPIFDAVFQYGDHVIKEGGEYDFDGHIVGIIRKRKGAALRYVVEDARGLLLIMNAKQLTLVERAAR